MGGSPSIRPGTWEDAGLGNLHGGKKAVNTLNVRSHKTLRQGDSVAKQDRESGLGWELEVEDESFHEDSPL